MTLYDYHATISHQMGPDEINVEKDLSNQLRRSQHLVVIYQIENMRTLMTST